MKFWYNQLCNVKKFHSDSRDSNFIHRVWGNLPPIIDCFPIFGSFSSHLGLLFLKWGSWKIHCTPPVTTVGWICTSFITSPVPSKKIEHSKRLTLTVISSFPLTWWEKSSCLMWSRYNNNNNKKKRKKNKKTRTRQTMPRTAKAIACYKAFCIFTTRLQIEQQIKPHQCKISQRIMYPITLKLWSVIHN